jgi:hypothetical protein
MENATKEERLERERTLRGRATMAVAEEAAYLRRG